MPSPARRPNDHQRVNSGQENHADKYQRDTQRSQTTAVRHDFLLFSPDFCVDVSDRDAGSSPPRCRANGGTSSGSWSRLGHTRTDFLIPTEAEALAQLMPGPGAALPAASPANDCLSLPAKLQL